LRAWIAQFGVPRALYTDWKNVYVRVPNKQELATGVTPLTQFGRMCATLGIRIIPASSPQAKGRVERQHGTHQDRLVKKLRRRGIVDLTAANGFLETEYWPEHNRRFAVAPRAGDDFHGPAPAADTLDRIFRLEETRTVANDWVVRYANRHFQLARQSQQPPARSTVQVFEDAAGQIEICYRARPVRWSEIAPAACRTRAAHPIAPRPAARPSAPARPSADHPWRTQAVEEHYAHQQLVKDRQAWRRAHP